MVEPKKPISRSLVEDRRQHGDVEEVPGRQPRIVGDEHVAGLERLRRERLDEVLAGGGQRVDVAGRAGDGLRHHAAAPVEQRVGEVAGLAHDRAEGDALQRLGLLVDDADQVAPEDLELDAVHLHLLLRRHDAAGRDPPSRASRAG